MAPFTLDTWEGQLPEFCDCVESSQLSLVLCAPAPDPFVTGWPGAGWPVDGWPGAGGLLVCPDLFALADPNIHAEVSRYTLCMTSDSSGLWFATVILTTA